MKSVLDSQVIEFPCPKCSKQLSESIGKLKLNPKLTCRHCGQVISTDVTDVRRKVAQFEKDLAQLGKAWKGLGKR